MKNKYKIKRLKDFPEHCKEACYAITEYGHTLFPSDVVKKLNDLELLLKQRSERSDNSDYEATPKCPHDEGYEVTTLNGSNYRACVRCGEIV